MSPDLLLFFATPVALQVLAKTLINKKLAMQNKSVARKENCNCTLLSSKSNV